MNPTLTPLQRLRSETPKFWIIVQVVCIILVAVAANLAKYQLIPNTVYLVIAGAASAVVFISQFAVKNGAEIAQLLADPSKLVEHLPEIIDLFKQLHENVDMPQPIGLPQLKSVAKDYPPLQVIPGDAQPSTPPADDIKEGA